MSMNKVQCPFEKNHLIQQSKLKAHIKKCKSEKKHNYQQCKFNSDHWIIFSKIKQHEQTCREQNENESVDDSVLEGFLKDLNEQDSMQSLSKNQIMQKDEKKLKKGKKVQEQSQQGAKKWQEPNFSKWVDENYVRKAKMLNWQELNKSDVDSFEMSSQEEGIHHQRL